MQRESLEYVQLIRGAERANSKVTTSPNSSHNHIHGKSFRKYEKFIKNYNVKEQKKLDAVSNSIGNQFLEHNAASKFEGNSNSLKRKQGVLDVILLVLQYVQRKEAERCHTIDKLEQSVSDYKKKLHKFEKSIKTLEQREAIIIKKYCEKEKELEETKQYYEEKISELEMTIKKSSSQNLKFNKSSQTVDVEPIYACTQTIIIDTVDCGIQTIEINTINPIIFTNGSIPAESDNEESLISTEAAAIIDIEDICHDVVTDLSIIDNIDFSNDNYNPSQELPGTPPIPPPAPPINDPENIFGSSNGLPSFLADIKNLNIDSESRVQAINQIQEQNITKEPRTSRDPLTSIFEEIRKLKPNSESRLKALTAAESARKQDLENNRKIIDKELKVQLGQLKKTGNIDKIEEQRQEKIKELIASIPLVQEYQYDDYDDDIELMDSSEEEEEEEEEDGGDLMSMITGFMKPEVIKPNIPTLKLPNNNAGENELMTSPSDDGGLTSMVSNLIKNRPSNDYKI